MSLIVRRFGIIIEKENDGPYHFAMTSTFFYHLCAYASLNKATKVGIEEIINTLKNFDYFEFTMRKDIIDAIFEEFNLDYRMHPFRKEKKKMKPVRFILFHNLQNNNKLQKMTNLY